MLTSLAALLLALVFLAILIWGADRLLALVPGYPKLIQAVRIIAIVVISIYVIGLIAGFFGIPVPWAYGDVRVHRRF
jgi:hypothetical protein